MATAPASDQHKLLQVQEIDTRVQQAEHRRASLPVIAEIADLEAQIAEVDQQALLAMTEVSDLRREVAKAEDDVQAVRTRAARDTERLNSGDGMVSKDLVALQSELDVLRKRISALEDVELDAMGRLEEAQAVVTAAEKELEATRASLAEAEQRRDAELEAIAAEIASLASQRVTAAMGIDADLMALYEKLRERNGGVGAAPLEAGACQGCHMNLNSADLAAAEAASSDTILRCEECGRILVRSGS